MSSRANVLIGILVAVIVFAVAVVWLATRDRTEEPEGAPEDTSGGFRGIPDAAAVEVPSANPYEDVPSLNPVEQANPFSKVKTNPFKR